MMWDQERRYLPEGRRQGRRQFDARIFVWILKRIFLRLGDLIFILFAVTILLLIGIELLLPIPLWLLGLSYWILHIQVVAVLLVFLVYQVGAWRVQRSRDLWLEVRFLLLIVLIGLGFTLEGYILNPLATIVYVVCGAVQGIVLLVIALIAARRRRPQ